MRQKLPPSSLGLTARISLAVRPVEGIIPRTRGWRGPEDPVGFQGGDPSADLGWRLLSNPLSCEREGERERDKGRERKGDKGREREG